MVDEVSACFKNAKSDEDKGKKHKGLLILLPDDKKARQYIDKAKKNLELCVLYKERGFDYKIPEEWFYTLYYCALAILSKFGIESRSQRCTAAFLKYAKATGLINYSDEYINRIVVYKDKDESSDVDEREKARYGAMIQIEEVSSKYSYMTELCKKAISEAEDVVYSKTKFSLPDEFSAYK
jgi:hypothetical protein